MTSEVPPPPAFVPPPLALVPPLPAAPPPAPNEGAFGTHYRQIDGEVFFVDAVPTSAWLAEARARREASSWTFQAMAAAARELGVKVSLARLHRLFLDGAVRRTPFVGLVEYILTELTPPDVPPEVTSEWVMTIHAELEHRSLNMRQFAKLLGVRPQALYNLLQNVGRHSELVTTVNAWLAAHPHGVGPYGAPQPASGLDKVYEELEAAHEAVRSLTEVLTGLSRQILSLKRRVGRLRDVR